MLNNYKLLKLKIPFVVANGIFFMVKLKKLNDKYYVFP
ncbi:hypothetical protein RC62_2073 [Flavobacterium aquidurense]|uniref:Uncharacterized protein n=1 Tax=Flavobacterium aquidurense TaxID=362413 RepID=A0A0Q0WSE6_9FLAO|nr:hypothetical protein RC62_2073 [Flavobacterium aquidurense]